MLYTLTTAEISSGKNARAFLVCEFLMKSFKKKYPEKLWELSGSYLLNSTANAAHFYPNRAGLTLLFSRKLLNGSQDFLFNILIFVYFFKYEIIETHVCAFLPLNISAEGSVYSDALMQIKAVPLLEVGSREGGGGSFLTLCYALEVQGVALMSLSSDQSSSPIPSSFRISCEQSQIQCF